MLNKNDLYLALGDIISMENYQLTEQELLEVGNTYITEHEYKVTQSELSELITQLISENY
jgi:hypothetical protein